MGMVEADGVAEKADPQQTVTLKDSDRSSGADATLNSSAAASFSATERAREERSIGPYQLITKLGEGGMGQVWLAEQTSPIHRQVALKLIRVGRYDDSVLQRFYSERQSLAMMDHPSIAKVFDAGATSDGQPYFVMEYVPGPPITTYCDRKRLKLRERLELFIKVCEGVQHAHQKAVMHRDLKPANILVMEVDGKPVPRIIDFGLAKPASPKLDGETLLLVTQAGGWVGTPGYMSPEQADPEILDVDTRTDVYSLGAVLYVLLTGVLPFETKQQRLDEFLRRLRDEDPARPSSKISADKGASVATAEARSAEARQLVSLLQGDLDWIAMKALERDRARRYGTPMELAADLDRYLHNEPVTARPGSVTYRARKYVLRHKAFVAATAAVFWVLIAGGIISTWEAVRARRAEARSKQESAIAQAVNEFLQHDLLAQASAARQSGPTVKPDPDLKVRTALDRAATRIDGKFAKQPEVEAAIRNTIGQTYIDLGIFAEASKQLERALDLRRRALGSEHPETLRSMHDLAIAYSDEGKVAQAETIANQAVEGRRRSLGAEHPDTLASMSILGGLLRDEGKYAQAEALCRQLLQIQQRVAGPEDSDTLQTMYYVGDIEWHEGKLAQAEADQAKTLEIRRRVLGPEHLETLYSMTDLAAIYADEGKIAQAEALYGQLLEIERRVLGPEHPGTLVAMNNLAALYSDEGKAGQAEALLIQFLETERRVLGAEHPDTITGMINLASIYGEEGKYGPAETLFTEALKISRRVLPPEQPANLTFLSEFGLMYQKEGKYALAQTYAAQSLAGRRHTLGTDQPDTIQSIADLALAYLSLGKFSESEPLAREAWQLNQKVQPDDWQRYRAETLLGASLAGEKKYAQGETLLVEGYQGMIARKDHIASPDRDNLELAHRWLVRLYKDWGKPAKAAAVAKSD